MYMYVYVCSRGQGWGLESQKSEILSSNPGDLWSNSSWASLWETLASNLQNNSYEEPQ